MTSGYNCGCKDKVSFRWPVWVPCNTYKKKCLYAEAAHTLVCRGRTAWANNAWYMGDWSNFNPICYFPVPNTGDCGTSAAENRDCEVLCTILK